VRLKDVRLALSSPHRALSNALFSSLRRRHLESGKDDTFFGS